MSFNLWSLTIFVIKPMTNNSEISFGFHYENALDIDEHINEPEEEERRKNQYWDLMLKPCALRITGTDSDGLKCTRERSCKRKSPG
jgi:hypothetical protein